VATERTGTASGWILPFEQVTDQGVRSAAAPQGILAVILKALAPASGGGRGPFQRDRIEAIRQLAGRSPAPGSGAEWREAFLAFVGGRTMSRSYKPVMLKAILRLVNHEGEIALDTLAAEFRAYYAQRRLDGLPVEFNVPLLTEPAEIPLEQIKRLIITNPLERFIIQGFLQHDAARGLIRFAPELWSELRHADVLAILAAADEQLAYYYGRQRRV
jgi:hypothetical protein